MIFRCRGLTRSLVASLGLVAGCQGLTGDSAERVAFGLREGASRLGQSRSVTDSLPVRIPARTWPNGCPGAYRVQLFADSAKVSGIVVSCLPKGRQYTTAYAKRFVSTPVTLEVERKSGQPVDIILRKQGKDIEVIGFDEP
jgi:hypothetical protein